MTKQVRIENADLTLHPVLVTVQHRSNGQWVDAEQHQINNPTQMVSPHVHSGQRVIVEERDASGSTARCEPSKVEIVTDAMVTRFLAWNLPKNFYPDGGVTVSKEARDRGLLTGTNLLDFAQAKTMLEHVLIDQPVAHRPV